MNFFFFLMKIKFENFLFTDQFLILQNHNIVLGFELQIHIADMK